MSRIRPLRRSLEVSVSAKNHLTQNESISRLGLASVENEIEAQFLVPKTSLSNLLSKSKLGNHLVSNNRADKLFKIRQFYISSEKRAVALDQLLAALPEVKDLLKFEISTFRLRAQKAIYSNFTLYFAQLKTRRCSLSRKEISIPLSFQLFRELLIFADEGYVAKNRLIKAAFFSDAGKRFRVEAHIDLIIALGIGKNRLTGSSLPDFLKKYAIVEIELPSENSYQILQDNCWGAFDFLESGFNLQDLQNLNGDKVSFRSLPMGKPAYRNIQEVTEMIELFVSPFSR